MIIKDESYYLLLRILFFLVFALSVAFILFADIREIIFRVPDDASYYLKIGENFNSGLGFTFDGINRTNGFQPLWQYAIIFITFLYRGSPESTLRLVLLIQVILLYFSGIILFKFLSQYFEKKIVLTAGIFYIIFVFFQSINGMETALLVFFISLLITYSDRYRVLINNNLRNEFVFGLIFGLIILARLDSVFFIIPVGVIFILKFLFNDKQKTLMPVFVFFSGAGLIILPYLIYNYVQFQNIIPISGYLKSSFPEINFNNKLNNMLHYREILFAFSAMIYLGWFAAKFKRNKNNFYLSSLAVMSSGVVLLFLYILFFMNWVIFSWYFITYSLFVSLAVCLPMKFILSKQKNHIGAALFWGFTIFISLYYGIKTYNTFSADYINLGSNWNIESYKASQWTKSNTGKADIFAMKDAGHFSYFSEREVINLDGLVNNFDYQEVIKNKSLNKYLKDNNVKYIVQHALWERNDITTGNYDTLELNFPSHRYSAESDPVDLKKADEVYRSEPYYDGDYYVAFLIWEIKH